MKKPTTLTSSKTTNIEERFQSVLVKFRERSLSGPENLYLGHLEWSELYQPKYERHLSYRYADEQDLAFGLKVIRVNSKSHLGIS